MKLNALVITLSVFVVIGLLFILGATLYLKYGKMKWLYHNILSYHEPEDYNNITFDGCNCHAVCKHCGKEIMQDSQGNWF